MDTIETFKPVYQRFLESGMIVRAFCKSSNLLESHFYYWQAKIRKEAIQQSGNFIPVSTTLWNNLILLYVNHSRYWLIMLQRKILG